MSVNVYPVEMGFPQTSSSLHLNPQWPLSKADPTFPSVTFHPNPEKKGTWRQQSSTWGSKLDSTQLIWEARLRCWNKRQWFKGEVGGRWCTVKVKQSKISEMEQKAYDEHSCLLRVPHLMPSKTSSYYTTVSDILFIYSCFIFWEGEDNFCSFLQKIITCHIRYRMSFNMLTSCHVLEAKGGKKPNK